MYDSPLNAEEHFAEPLDIDSDHGTRTGDFQYDADRLKGVIAWRCDLLFGKLFGLWLRSGRRCLAQSGRWSRLLFSGHLAFGWRRRNFLL